MFDDIAPDGAGSFDDFGFDTDQERVLGRIRGLLDARMATARRRRIHSLGVARTAAELACAYGVDAYLACAAGLVHDWDKVLEDDELVARAIHYGVPVAGPPALAAPLLHGPVAARELPELFPELPGEVFRAVERHTVAAPDMSPLDMVVFVADAIEPGRRGDYARTLRDMAGEAPLEELFFACFSQGLAYVISGGRYLYPTAVDIYNHYALARSGRVNEKGTA